VPETRSRPGRGRRLLDLSVAVPALVVLSPFFGVAVALIKLSSKGPAIYRQERIGRDGRPFPLYKFRTMRVAKGGALVTAQGDPRVTAVGRLLRRWKIDEWPQLLNLLRGDMTLIGPRPEVERYVRHYTPSQRSILKQTPGFASMAQLVYACEAEMLREHPDPERAYVEQLMPRKLAVDLEYERSRTFVTDLRLMGRLALMILGSRRHADTTFRLEVSGGRQPEGGASRSATSSKNARAQPAADSSPPDSPSSIV